MENASSKSSSYDHRHKDSNRYSNRAHQGSSILLTASTARRSSLEPSVDTLPSEPSPPSSVVSTLNMDFDVDMMTADVSHYPGRAQSVASNPVQLEEDDDDQLDKDQLSDKENAVRTLKESLNNFRDKNEWSDQEAAYIVLKELFVNIITKPNEDRFKRIRIDNPRAQQILLSKIGGMDLILAAGFKEAAATRCMVASRGGDDVHYYKWLLNALTRHWIDAMHAHSRQQRDSSIAEFKEQNTSTKNYVNRIAKLKNEVGEERRRILAELEVDKRERESEQKELPNLPVDRLARGRRRYSHVHTPIAPSYVNPWTIDTSNSTLYTSVFPSTEPPRNIVRSHSQIVGSRRSIIPHTTPYVGSHSSIVGSQRSIFSQTLPYATPLKTSTNSYYTSAGQSTFADSGIPSTSRVHRSAYSTVGTGVLVSSRLVETVDHSGGTMDNVPFYMPTASPAVTSRVPISVTTTTTDLTSPVLYRHQISSGGTGLQTGGPTATVFTTSRGHRLGSSPTTAGTTRSVSGGPPQYSSRNIVRQSSVSPSPRVHRRVQETSPYTTTVKLPTTFNNINSTTINGGGYYFDESQPFYSPTAADGNLHSTATVPSYSFGRPLRSTRTSTTSAPPVYHHSGSSPSTVNRQVVSPAGMGDSSKLGHMPSTSMGVITGQRTPLLRPAESPTGRTGRMHHSKSFGSTATTNELFASPRIINTTLNPYP